MRSNVCSHRGPNDFAALIVEPLVLGAGGMRMYAPEVLAEIAALCRRHEVFLIADEVMTGFGRTGTMFACEQAGVAPDLMCLSKGLTGGFLPMGATLASAEIYDAFYSTRPRQDVLPQHVLHGKRDRLRRRRRQSGDLGARAGRGAHRGDRKASRPGTSRDSAARPQVKDARTCGTIAAIELAVPDGGYFAELGPKLNRFYLERDVLLRTSGTSFTCCRPIARPWPSWTGSMTSSTNSLALVRD